MVALLSNAAATVRAARYAANWRLGDAKDSRAIANAEDWRPGQLKNLRQLLCRNNDKSYKIETKDIDIKASNAILALGVGHCAIA